MTPLIDSRWIDIISIIKYAFQPIVNIHTGECYAYEALLRNYKKAGFSSIDDFFDKAYCENLLHQVDLALREKAIRKFSKIKTMGHPKLFFNLDNRILSTQDYQTGFTKQLLKKYNIAQDLVTFEISEKTSISNPMEMLSVLKRYRSQNYKIAIDDYGIGISGLQMLYYTEPEFIKIDRFFIADIQNDLKKKLLVASIVDIAHLLGSVVIAEGVETSKEYFICRDIGCDLVQGYFIQHPELSVKKLQDCYPEIEFLNKSNQRNIIPDDKLLLKSEIEYIEPILNTMSAYDVFEKFRTKNRYNLFPIINHNKEPVGVIRESSLKDYAYSRYGQELLLNPSYGKKLNNFINKFPVADIHTPIEKILEIYSLDINIEGILIVNNMSYVGFLTATSLLKVINEKNLTLAREQNPLTKLPGNNSVYRYVSKAIRDTSNQYVLTYFDFDNFKPYNDYFGFRNGDRVILLFAELLKKYRNTKMCFIAHIGGDDFFIGLENVAKEQFYKDVELLKRQFKIDVESFYNPEDIEKGYILSKNRDGDKTCYPLLTVSAAVLDLPIESRKASTPEEIGSIMAVSKKKAKLNPNGIHWASLSILDRDNKFNQNKEIESQVFEREYHSGWVNEFLTKSS
ncbi:MAG: GGDEF domain-containing protein [Desulfobacterales bacterium]|nr:GGDEF domain-containing protein [Desulfobacterales bacterium]